MFHVKHSSLTNAMRQGKYVIPWVLKHILYAYIKEKVRDITQKKRIDDRSVVATYAKHKPR